jgi:hypothetical protein
MCSMLLIVVCWIMDDEVLDVWTDDDDDVIRLVWLSFVFCLLSHQY